MRRTAVITALAVATATVAAVSVSAAGSANAAPSAESVGTIKRAATSYSNPTNQSIPVHFGLQPGEQVLVRCFVEGQELGGTSYWFRIGKDDRLGFVHRDAIVPPAGVPHC